MLRKLVGLFVFLTALFYSAAFVLADDEPNFEEQDAQTHYEVVQIQNSSSNEAGAYVIYEKGANTEQQEQTTKSVKGDVIALIKYPKGVKTIDQLALKSDVFSQQMNSVAEAAGGQIVEIYDELSTKGKGIFTLIHSDTVPENEMLENLEGNSEIIGASLNYEIKIFDDKTEILEPNDPRFNDSGLWGLKAIRAPEAWLRSTGDENTYVAIIDSGIDFPHEDLTENIEGWNFSKSFTGSTTAYDEHSHGTHVAGTIGARGDNSKGVAGVNWKTNLIALKVFNASGRCATSVIIEAVNYLIKVLDKNPETKFTAVNMSLGGYNPKTPDEMINTNDPEYVALKALSDTNRVLICVAAGNESVEVGKKSQIYGGYCYPASLKGIDNMIVVASVGNTLQKSSFSNYSAELVDIAAPGGDVLSTIPNNGYASKSGTSMATPHVTGAVNLLASIFPQATPEQIKNAILNGANKNYMTNYTAHGLLDLMGAIAILDDEDWGDTAPAITSSQLPEGYIDEAYDFEFKAKSTTPLEWELVSGDLPEGLEFNASTAKLTGTPTEAGEFEFTISATNSIGVDTKILTLTISNAKPQIIRTILNEGSSTKGENYSDTLIAKGAKPITWSLADVEENNLPRGLTLSADGTVTGIPEKHGTYKFNVTATNQYGSDTAEITIRISGIKAVIASELLGLSGYIGEEFSFTPVVIGSRPIKHTYDGILPPGLSFDTNTGTISGIPTGDRDAYYSFNIRVENEYGTYSDYFPDRYGSIYIYKPTEIKITTDKLPMAIKDVPYNFKLQAEGEGDITWSTENKLPNGLTLASDGTISGVLDVQVYGGGGRTFKASNGKSSVKKYLWFEYSKEETKITLEKLPNATVGNSYSQTIFMTGYGSVAAEITDGELPEGLYLTGANDTGLYYPYIKGNPQKAGTYKFKVRVAWKGGSDHYDEKEFTLVVNGNGDSSPIIENPEPTGEAPEITTQNLPSGELKNDYLATIEADGANPITFSLTAGNLPTGLTLNSDGIITGTPTEKGIFDFTVTAENEYGKTSKEFSIEITGITTDIVLPDAIYKQSYKGSETVDDTSKNTQWKISEGSLPKGLTLVKKGVEIKLTGKPSEVGEFNFKATGTTPKTKTEPAKTVEKSVSLKVLDAEPKISTSSLKAGTLAKAYSKVTLKASSKCYSLTWSAEGLPDGLTLNATTGLITGTPLAAGDFEVVVTAKNYDGVTAEKTLKLKIKDITIKNSSLKNGTVNQKYSVKMNLSDKPAGSITWSAENLPNGLYINSAGTITGSPTEYGKFENVKIIASFSNIERTREYSLTIKNAKPKILTSSLASATEGQYYTVQLLASDPNAEWSWSGKTPDGLYLSSNGQISGAPTKAGSYSVKITAVNDAGKATKSITIKVLKASTTSNTNSILTEQAEQQILNNDTAIINDNQEFLTPNAEINDFVSSGANGFIDDENYLIIAEFDNITVEKSGQYEFVIELDKNFDGELFWFANPVNAEATDDDFIADFYDGETGEEVFSVPESNLINVNAWLNAEIIYKPVLAVKIK